MRIVLLGGPGVGKGTQAQRLSTQFSLEHISTGDMLRQAIKDGTKLGLEAKSYMEKGLLVPDDIIIGMIRDRLAQIDKFILDGFPRTIPQAEALDKLTEELKIPLDAVVNIKASSDVIVQRLSGRRTCRDCQAVYHILYSPPQKDGICDKCGGQLYQRDDDKEETIRQRLSVYEKQTAPLLDYYAKSGKLIEVFGDPPIEEVYESIVQALRKANIIN